MSAFNTKLYQSAQLKQEMKINPRLYQAMELLYMPLLDLQQHLKTELAENPFLELTDADVEDQVEIDEEGKEEKEDEMDWEEILLDGFDVGGRKQQYEHKEYFQPTPVASADLQDHLAEQLHHLPLTEREMRIGEELIGNIDDDGSLSCPLEQVLSGVNDWLDEARAVARDRISGLAELDENEHHIELRKLDGLFEPYSFDEVEQALEVLQRFDPAGVGGRDLRETILIQLRVLVEDDSTVIRIVETHFADLIAHRWSDIAKAMSITPREVQDAADELAKLDPKPGLKYSAEPDHYVIPDLVVEDVDGEYMVFVNDTNLPRLRLSQSYREVARDKNQFKGENKEFISSKLNSANWMIQAIEQRRQTMLKVMNYIVDRQRAFFDKGVQHLKPLTLREVAEHIDMHESTVSRVTNEKFVQTPRGVFSLKYFFSSGLSTSTGEDISARGVKAKIQLLVNEEDSKKPLTDQTIVNLLKADGVKIARRTVAKYRDQLGILPARMRKRV